MLIKAILPEKRRVSSARCLWQWMPVSWVSLISAQYTPWRLSQAGEMLQTLSGSHTETKWNLQFLSYSLLRTCTMHTHSHCYRNHYLRQGGYIFVGLRLSVCLSVCEQDNSKLWTDLSKILRVCRAWHKLQVIQFRAWSGRNPRFWITLKFSLPLH